ncbi:hypothetical protein [Ileibacterium valens]|uniref:hypothetical protein n=1 Tax=Ileibacterium valens TaxID=1862668 RepID=UPI00272A4D47|nr:hypothetical protein [Ileibacterium valens]
MSIEDERKKYRQVFSQIHIPQKIEVNVERNTRMNWMKKHAAALSAALLILSGSSAAYAADLGGIRTQVTYWLNGSLEEIEAVSNEDGGYDFYKEGEDEPFVSGGGVWIDDFGNEHALDAQDVADSALNEDVHIKDDDTIWLKTRLGEWDITDLFRDQDTVRVTDGDRYYEISCAKDLSSTSMRSFHEPFGNAEFVNLQSS